MRLLLVTGLVAAALAHDTLTKISLSLSESGGDTRKCTAHYGTYAGREDTLSLFANKGISSINDTSDSTDGLCTFHSNVDKGHVEPYSVSADMYHSSTGNNAKSRAGIAFNVIDKCTFDFVYFRAQEVGGCFQLGSMRGCHWSPFSWVVGPCPDGPTSFDQWYSVKADVTADTITISKKEPFAAWSRVVSVPTNNFFGNHPVARAGLVVLNGFGDTTYFNRLELEYTAPPPMKSFNFKLEGTATINALHTAKRNAVALFEGLSPDLKTRFVAEPSAPTSSNNRGLMTVSLPLTEDGGVIRKCTPGYGTYGGRQDSISLYGNFGDWHTNLVVDDTSDSSKGWCTFLSNEDKEDAQPYTVTVDMNHVKASNTAAHAGLAFNVIDKCNFDFVYFAPHWTESCYRWGAMRGCMWTVTPAGLGSCPDGHPGWNTWYSIKVDVTASSVTIWKKNLGAAWVQGMSVATSNTFGGHPVARVGLLVANHFEDTTYFNRLELEYPVTFSKNAFILELSGTAASGPLGNAKRATVDALRNISSDLSIQFTTEPSQPRRLLV